MTDDANMLDESELAKPFTKDPMGRDLSWMHVPVTAHIAVWLAQESRDRGVSVAELVAEALGAHVARVESERAQP